MAALLAVALIAALGRPQAIGPLQVSTSGIVQIASIPLLGPVGAALVGALPVVVDRNEPLKRLYNASQRVIFLLAGATVYVAVGGRTLTAGADDIGPLTLAVAMGCASMSVALVNVVLLSGVLQRSNAGSLRAIGTDLLRQIVPSYVSYAVAAYLLVILWAPGGLDWASILFFLPSILSIQWGLHQHADLWATRHELLIPFVRALDLRHPGAADEARLAAGAATAVATGIGLSPEDVDRVTTAARLRDVGLLALDGAPAAIVRRDHSAAAREVIGAVTFLESTLAVIDGHHERVDGGGQPAGLSGHHIPIGAKVVAVADTWAHLVAEGWSSPDAVDHCESVAGRMLDKECVAALRRALDREQLPGGAS